MTEFSAYDKLLEGVQVISPDMRYLYVNQTVCAHAKVPADQLLGFAMKEVFPGIERTELYSNIQACWKKQKPREYVNEFHFPNGDTGYFLLRMQPIEQGVLIMSHDVSEKIHFEKQLQQQNKLLEQKNEELLVLNEKLNRLSVTDELTNVFNRRHFVRCLNEEVARFSRTGEVFSLALLDIDDFKKINDNYGHTIGDQVLLSFATVLKRHMRQYDLLARYGGEEFTLLMPGTGLQQAQYFLTRLEDSVLRAVALSKYCVTFSAGLTQPDQPNCDANTLMRRADKALYEAKHAGKHCVRVYGVDVGRRMSDDGRK